MQAEGRIRLRLSCHFVKGIEKIHDCLLAVLSKSATSRNDKEYPMKALGALYAAYGLAGEEGSIDFANSPS